MTNSADSRESSNNDIHDALIQLWEEIQGGFAEMRSDFGKMQSDFKALGDKVDKQDYKFDAYQKGIDGMVRMSITIIIATATVVVLPSLSPAITALVTALTSMSAQ